MDEDIISGLLTMGALLIGLSGSIASAWAKRRGRKGAGPVADASEEPVAAVLDGRDDFRIKKSRRRASPPVGNSGRGGVAPSKAPVAVMPEERPAEESLAGEFDLRRAVIYSEILNPKFKEEDNF